MKDLKYITILPNWKILFEVVNVITLQYIPYYYFLSGFLRSVNRYIK